MCYWTNAVALSTRTGPKGWPKFAKDHLIKDRQRMWRTWRTMVRSMRETNLPMRPKKHSFSNWKWLLLFVVHPSDIFPFHSMSVANLPPVISDYWSSQCHAPLVIHGKCWHWGHNPCCWSVLACPNFQSIKVGLTVGLRRVVLRVPTI